MYIKKVDYSGYFPMVEYYKKVVRPLGKKYSVTKGNKMVCPLHDDIGPSMGIIPSKEEGEVFHCFGCGLAGNVVELHQRVSYLHFNKKLTRKESIKELSKLFGLDYKGIPTGEIDEIEVSPDKDMQRALAMREAEKSFDIAEFRAEFIEGKMENKPISYFNSLLVRMIDKMNTLREESVK